MKKLILLVVLFPVFAFSMHHKSDPIIFYLDLKVKNNSVNIEEFLDGVVKSVNETEPGTMLYEYYLSEDKKKVSLIEIYKTCLLYTSPSPRDVEESRMPSSA